MNRSNFLRAGLAAAIVALLATSASAKVVSIVIEQSRYTPKKVMAEVGDTVEWINRDTIGHTVSARDKSFEVVLSPGATERLVLSHPGKFYYYCHFHAYMMASVEILVH